MNEAQFQPATAEDLYNSIQALTETIYAIELLEYHDKNHLSGDNKTRNEFRRSVHLNILEKVRELKKMPQQAAAVKP